MSAAELEPLLRRVLGEGIQLPPAIYLLLVVVSLLGGTVGAFFGAYSRKRGENLATKADFESLLQQLRRQTEETERIKSEIARAGWIHQRRWEAQALIEAFAKHMYERGTLEKLLAYKGVAGMILTEHAGAALDRLSYEYNEMANLLIRDARPADAFFRYGRPQFDGLLAQTEEVYRLVLSESQADLLGHAEAGAAF